MLVLERKLNQVVEITHGNETIHVYFSGVRKVNGAYQAKLAFDGPRSFEVHRGERHLKPATRIGAECD